MVNDEVLRSGSSSFAAGGTHADRDSDAGAGAGADASSGADVSGAASSPDRVRAPSLISLASQVGGVGGTGGKSDSKSSLEKINSFSKSTEAKLLQGSASEAFGRPNASWDEFPPLSTTPAASGGWAETEAEAHAYASSSSVAASLAASASSAAGVVLEPLSKAKAKSRSLGAAASEAPLAKGETAARAFSEFTFLPAPYHAEVEATDRAFKLAALTALALWAVLLAAVLQLAPEDSYHSLDETESRCTLVVTAVLLFANLFRLIPLVRRSKKGAFSGIIVAASAIQFVAMMTNALMLLMPTPVIVDPVTMQRVHLLRWVEWTPLAGIMMFLVEGMDVPHPEYGKKLAVVQGVSLGISTSVGLVLPFLETLVARYLTLTVSCLLFSAIYFSVHQKRVRFAQMKRGRLVDENEQYERARLSLHCMEIQSALWSTLVATYFLGWFGKIALPQNPLLASPSFPMVSDTIWELCSKTLFIIVIVDVHNEVFDENTRVMRKLQALRYMMSAVWESSSDIIAVSVKNSNSGGATAMVSPTMKQLEKAIFIDKGPKIVPKAIEGDPGNTKTLVFELDASDLGIVPDVISSFSYMKEGDDGGDATKEEEPLYKLRAEKGYRINPKRVHHIELKAMSSETRIEHSTTNGCDPESGKQEVITAIAELVVRAWHTTGDENMLVHDVVRKDPYTGQVSQVRCEAKVTRLDEYSILVVIRDISERFSRFQAEKRVLMERTARVKDAEANRFTRHEVKNGLLAAIGLCDSLSEAFGDGKQPVSLQGTTSSKTPEIDVRQCVSELDSTLREVLDTVLAQSMARDVMHAAYEPKDERVDISTVLYGVRGEADHKQNQERFPLSTDPSPLPHFMLDPQLLRFVHRNAISNACKYGKRGGSVVTKFRFDENKNELLMKVINCPGRFHDELVQLGDAAAKAVFEPGRRLHPFLGTNQGKFDNTHTQTHSHSSGDGAWIMKKCAKTLGGGCSIKFEPERTVFSLWCPAKRVATTKRRTGKDHSDNEEEDVSNFRLLPNTWGIAIDDSKIQRKLLAKMLGLCGVDKAKTLVLGESDDDIMGFEKTVVTIIRENPDDFVLIIIDENLDVKGEHGVVTVSGSRCIERMREVLSPNEEAKVLALVRSANDSREETELYITRAHGYLPKAPIKKDTVLETIAPWWIKKFGGYTSPSDETMSARPSLTEFGEIEVSSSEIEQTLEVIDALCIQGSPASIGERWPVIWEKLHKLKGDIKTLKENDLHVTALLDGIDRMQGSKCPDDFLKGWMVIRSLAVGIVQDSVGNL